MQKQIVEISSFMNREQMDELDARIKWLGGRVLKTTHLNADTLFYQVELPHQTAVDLLKGYGYTLFSKGALTEPSFD